MTLGAKLRRSTKLEINFPELSRVTLSPREVVLHQCVGKHDVCEISFDKPTTNYYDNLHTGTAIQILWQQNGRQREWLGYVSYVKKPQDGSLQQEVRVVCLGTSFALKQNLPKAFKEATYPDVARRLSKEFGLRFDGINHPRRFPNVTTSSETYWQFLTRIAKDIGYVFFVDNSTLIFKPIDKILEESAEDTPLLQFWGQGKAANDFGLDRTLDSFEFLYGDYVEDGFATRARKTLAGMEPVTGKKIIDGSRPNEKGKNLREEIADVVFDEHISDTNVSSRLLAKEISQGMASLAKFTIPAKMTAQGDPRIRPHTLVYVSGISNEADGYWYVRSVVHTIKAGGLYGCEIVAASDGIGGVSAFKNKYQSLKPRNTRTSRQGVGTLNLESYLKSNSFETVTVTLPDRVQLSSDYTVLRTKRTSIAKTDRLTPVKEARAKVALNKWQTSRPTG